mmetsp:Transcript_21646/g.37865  ORF Transcript_21646/g.37865 Transcript_21646/m.37865 type:complete len:98 (+) Transcript_21646:358-651(+)
MKNKCTVKGILAKMNLQMGCPRPQILPFRGGRESKVPSPLQNQSPPQAALHCDTQTVLPKPSSPQAITKKTTSHSKSMLPPESMMKSSTLMHRMNTL